ncbi:unnamed protein product, partial [Discosporangium mesarthrocarpum]
CLGRSKAKINVPSTTMVRAKRPYVRICIHLAGSNLIPTPNGERCAMGIFDDYSRYTEIFFLWDKTEATVTPRRFYEQSALPSGAVVRYVRHDPRGEWHGEGSRPSSRTS